MDIAQITTSTFQYEGVEYSVFTRRFLDFTDFQKYLERGKEKGKTKLFIHSIFTLPKQLEIWVKYKLI